MGPGFTWTLWSTVPWRTQLRKKLRKFLRRSRPNVFKLWSVYTHTRKDIAALRAVSTQEKTKSAWQEARYSKAAEQVPFLLLA